VLIIQLVRVRGSRRPLRADTRLGSTGRGRLGSVNVLGCRVVSWEVFNVEGCRLALSTDISYGCGTFLIHHLHALTLPRLDTLLIVRTGTRSHGRHDLAHRR